MPNLEATLKNQELIKQEINPGIVVGLSVRAILESSGTPNVSVINQDSNQQLPAKVQTPELEPVKDFTFFVSRAGDDFISTEVTEKTKNCAHDR